MNGSLKKSSRILYGVCSCIIVLMVICYFGVSNTKGTYSADVQVTCAGTIYSGTKAWHSGGVYYCCPASTSEMTGGRCYYYNNDCGSKAQCDDVNPTGANWSCSTSYESVLTGYKRTCSVSAVRAIPVSDDSPSSGACYIAAHMYQWFTSKPSGSWTKVERSQSNCKGCESGYTLNDDEECVFSSGTVSAAGCYTAAYMYQWFDNKPSGDAWTKVSVTKENCKGCVPGYTLNDDEECVLTSSPSHCYICLGTSGSVSTGGTYKQSTSSPGTNCHLTSSTTCSGTPVAKKYECTLTDNSKVCVTAYDSAWASADVGETGTSCKEVTSCSPTPGGGPTSGGGTNPPSSSSSSSTTLSSSSSNVDDNPKTGSVAIFIVWVIALGTLIYSFVYFKQSKFE